MDFMWIYIISVFVNLVNGHNGYYISNQHVSAGNATSICTLATPDYIPDGKTYGININVSSTESLWVGYAETAFSYRGCTPEKDLKGTKSISMKGVTTNPSSCYLHCETIFVGIARRKNTAQDVCYCIPILPMDINLRDSSCNDSCKFPKDSLCGSQNAASIYEKVRYPTRVASQIGESPQHCLAYEPSDKKFIWTVCSYTLRSLCLDDTNVLVNDSAKDGSWTGIMTECLNQGMVPAPLSGNFSRLPSGGSQFWTGTIRSFSTCQSPGSPCSVNDSSQGYIQKSTTPAERYKYMLQFGQTQSLASLCESGTEIATSSVEISTTSAQATSSAEISTTSAQATSSAEISTTSAQATSSAEISTTSAQERTSKDSVVINNSSEISSIETTTVPQDSVTSAAKDSKSDMVPVYVLVPLTVVLIAAVIGFIIWRKRRSSVDKPTGDMAFDNGSEPNAGIGLSNASYQDDCLDKPKKDAMGHNYFVLEPSNEYAVIKETDTERPNEEEYDTTMTVNKKANGTAYAPGNIYNRLDLVDDTSTHSNTVISKHNDTYSHIEVGNVAGISDGQGSKADAEGRRTNDINSCLDGTMIKQNVSQTKPTCSDLDNVDDTYNHTDGFTPEIKQKSSKAVSNSTPITRPFDTKVRPEKVNYDYAYATNVSKDGTTKACMFTISQLPNSDNYDFAKEPSATSPDYELAKPQPMPVYLELSNV